MGRRRGRWPSAGRPAASCTTDVPGPGMVVRVPSWCVRALFPPDLSRGGIMNVTSIIKMAVAVTLAGTALVGCSTVPLIYGTWQDDFGTTHAVSEAMWVSTGDGWESKHHVAEVGEGFLLAHNDENNDFSAELYSRFDFLEDSGGDVWFCQSVFDGSTLEDARDGSADSSDLEVAGCAGFGWTLLH